MTEEILRQERIVPDLGMITTEAEEETEEEHAMDDAVQTPQQRYGQEEDRKEMRRLTPSKMKKPPPPGKRAKNPNYKPKERPKPRAEFVEEETPDSGKKCTLQ